MAVPLARSTFTVANLATTSSSQSSSAGVRVSAFYTRWWARGEAKSLTYQRGGGSDTPVLSSRTDTAMLLSKMGEDHSYHFALIPESISLDFALVFDVLTSFERLIHGDVWCPSRLDWEQEENEKNEIIRLFGAISSFLYHLARGYFYMATLSQRQGFKRHLAIIHKFIHYLSSLHVTLANSTWYHTINYSSITLRKIRKDWKLCRVWIVNAAHWF